MSRRPLVTLIGLYTALVAACPRQQQQPRTPSAEADPRASDPIPAIAPARFHALLISGGATPDQNYQSHLLHIKELSGLLLQRGIPRERIAIFASDGSNPAPDLAVRAMQPERDFWQLEGTSLEGVLQTPVELASSQVEGMPLQPATEAALQRWFTEAGKTLRPGDTLLLYVTDHGTRNPRDPNNNRISLWGKDAHLTVDGLAALLARLQPGVRVVALMSQCFSGGFARLYQSGPAAGGAGFCGYFSSTAERPAYGCYPENRDKDNVGYSFHFFEELASGRSLPAAHREVLTSDRTPDVPLRTSDLYLEDLLARAARAAGQPATAFIDSLLAEAWKDRKTWEPEIRLLDRVGKTFGMWSPRSLGELDGQTGGLPAFAESIGELKDAWAGGLQDLNVGRLDRFARDNPTWKGQLDPERLSRLSQPDRRKLSAGLLAALSGYDLERKRLQALRQRSELAAALDYRMEVRTGALLRLRTILSSVAGRVLLSRPGREKERQHHHDLQACESLRLPPAPPQPRPRPTPPAAFPAFADEVAAAGQLVPTYIGIRFGSTSADQQKRYDLPAGAAVIQNLYVDSPAQKAGLLPGDVVLGLPGKPFSLHNEVRLWTFFATAGVPQPLEVLRGHDRLQLTIVPQPRPNKLPSLPEPARPQSRAPGLSLTPYRGKVFSRLDDGSPHLLFFWGTFCGPCKSSLPEVLAFSRERGVPVLAITDEPAETVDGFFAGWKQPFPENVALDDFRRTVIAYGVSGVPTFVLVDGQGKVISHFTGYDAASGLRIPDWRWRH